MKSLASKVVNSVKKVILPVIVTGSLLYSGCATSHNAQKPNYPKDHNYGATIQSDTIRVNGALERKVTHGSGKYFQNIPLTVEGKKAKELTIEDMFGEELGLASSYFNTAMFDWDAYSKKPLKLSADQDNTFYWTLAKDKDGNQITMVPLEMTGDLGIFAEILCNQQAAKADGITDKNPNYIRTEHTQDILSKPLQTITLKRIINGKEVEHDFYFPLIASKNRDSTEMEHYLIPVIEDYTRLRALPAEGNTRKRQLAIISPWVYKAGLDKEKELVITETEGSATDAFAEDIKLPETKTEKIDSTAAKENNWYVMFGVNGSNKSIAGQLGFQYGPVAVVGSVGKGFDETIMDVQTDPLSHGIYTLMNEENTNVTNTAIRAELHPFHKRKVSPYTGFEVNNSNYSVRKQIDIMKDIANSDDEQLSSKTSSRIDSKVSYSIPVGVNFRTGERSQIGAEINYNLTTEDISGGFRYTREF